MMADKVQIINRALNLIGQGSISSDSEENKRALAMDTAWQLIVPELMNTLPWRFTVKQVRVAAIDVTGIADYNYAYRYPNDCIRVLAPVGDATTRVKVKGDVIYSNSNELTLLYVSNQYLTDTSKWSVGFAKCVSYLLALECCYRLTTSTKREDRLTDVYYNSVLPDATGSDVLQEVPEQVENYMVEIGDAY